MLLVTRNLPPLLGGMERLNWHMVEELAQFAQTEVVAPQDSLLPPDSGASLHGTPGRPLWRFLAAAGLRAAQRARRWRPHVVLAGSGLTAPLAWIAAQCCGARAAVYLHGLDIGLRHPVYSMLWLPFIRRMDIVIANSNATREMALGRGIASSRIRLLHPGVAAPVPLPPPGPSQAEFRLEHRLDAGPILLSVGRLTERKGLREFVRDVMPLIAARRPDVQLVVVGDTAGDALAARSQSRQSIMGEAARHGLGARVHFIGAITDRAALGAAYRAAALHVFPVRQIEGDPEGFGMVAVEAAAQGLPTVAYSTGGVVDAVSEGVTGYLVPAHNAEAFALKTCDLLEAPLPSAPMQAFAATFAWPAFGGALRTILMPPSDAAVDARA